MRKLTELALATALVGLMAFAAGADGKGAKPTKHASCLGQAATIVGTQRADATSGRTQHAEMINGTSSNDVFAARGGADQVSGNRGDDLTCGGMGRDTLQG